MNEPGAYIVTEDGQTVPDLNDEAMAARKKLADDKAAAENPPATPKKGKAAEPQPEVTNA